MLHQDGSVTTSPVHHAWNTDVDSELDRALRDLDARPTRLLRALSPVSHPDSVRSLSPALDLPFLHTSSSPTWFDQRPGSHEGLEALMALRSAMQLRESQLHEPQDGALVPAPHQADRRMDEAEHGSPISQPHSQLQHGMPALGPRRTAEAQAPHATSDTAHALTGNTSPSELTHAEARERSGQHRSAVTALPAEPTMSRQVLLSCRSHHFTGDA